MLNTRGMTNAKYKDSSIEELKAEYEKLIKEECYFETKEEQMKHDISIAPMQSSHLNYFNNKKNELLELIKEKSGETYEVEIKTFNYSLDELIDFVADKSIDPFWNMSLKNFFKKLDDTKHDEWDKKQFLCRLANQHNKQKFNDFSRELTGDYNPEELFIKYTNSTFMED